MSKDNIEDIAVIVGNLVWFGMFWYAVFILGYSGWWFVLPVTFHFSKDKPDDLLATHNK